MKFALKYALCVIFNTKDNMWLICLQFCVAVDSLDV